MKIPLLTKMCLFAAMASSRISILISYIVLFTNLQKSQTHQKELALLISEDTIFLILYRALIAEIKGCF
jgi:hypothetical protein